MRRLFWLLILYVIVHSSRGDFSVAYEGMDEAAITATIAQTYNCPFDFVTLDEYNAFNASQQTKKG